MPPPATDPLKIWCLLIDNERKAGDEFSVRLQPNATIENLKEAVKEEQSDVLIVPRTLTVWRCKDPEINLKVIHPNIRNQKLKEIFQKEEKVAWVSPTLEVEQFKDAILLVEVPASEGRRVSGTPEMTPFRRPFVENKYSTPFTFTIRRRIGSAKPEWPSVCNLNQYLKLNDLPKFIKDVLSGNAE